jgi:hypothetical protein
MYVGSPLASPESALGPAAGTAAEAGAELPKTAAKLDAISAVASTPARSRPFRDFLLRWLVDRCAVWSPPELRAAKSPAAWRPLLEA